jgi:hypothetical protein
MPAAIHILRIMLASLVAFWLPMQCCSAAVEANERADEVQAGVAAVAPEHCEMSCCSREGDDAAVKQDARPHHPADGGPCDCGAHPASLRAAVVDGSRVTMESPGAGGIFHDLPPLPSFIAVLSGGDNGRLHRVDSPRDLAPAVTLRALSVLLTV